MDLSMPTSTSAPGAPESNDGRVVVTEERGALEARGDFYPALGGTPITPDYLRAIL